MIGGRSKNRPHMLAIRMSVAEYALLKVVAIEHGGDSARAVRELVARAYNALRDPVARAEATADEIERLEKKRDEAKADEETRHEIHAPGCDEGATREGAQDVSALPARAPRASAPRVRLRAGEHARVDDDAIVAHITAQTHSETPARVRTCAERAKPPRGRLARAATSRKDKTKGETHTSKQKNLSARARSR